MEQFLVPTATVFLAIHSLMLFVSGVGHLVRQHLSPAPVDGTDMALSIVLGLLGLFMFGAYRLFDNGHQSSGSDESGGEKLFSQRTRLVLFGGVLIESVLAVVFYWTIVENPSNGVSDFILGFAATTGVFTSAVLIVSAGMISKRA